MPRLTVAVEPGPPCTVMVVVLFGTDRHLQAEDTRGPVLYFEKQPGFGLDAPRGLSFDPAEGTKQVDTVVTVEVEVSDEIVVVVTL